MLNRPLRFAACLGLAIFFRPSFVCAQVTPPIDPASLPAHDSHQGVTIAVKPLTTEADYNAQFTGHTPYEAGIVALEVFFRNDNDKPIRLNLTTIRLFVGGKPPQRIEPLSSSEVADRVLLKTPSNPRAVRLPIPGSRPPTGNRDKNWQEYQGRIQAAGIQSDILAPKSTLRGFIFFDLDHHYAWLSDARLDVPDLSFMLDNQALFFFQVDLAPAVR